MLCTFLLFPELSCISVDTMSMNMSDFKVHILTIFLAPECSQGNNWKNEPLYSPIGRWVPSGYFLKIKNLHQKFVDVFGFALSLLSRLIVTF